MNGAEIDRRHEENIRRLIALEFGQAAILEKQTHLDHCMDGVKAKLDVWNRRFLIVIGVAVGMSIMSGSGTVSLHTLLEWIKAAK